MRITEKNFEAEFDKQDQRIRALHDGMIGPLTSLTTPQLHDAKPAVDLWRQASANLHSAFMNSLDNTSKLNRAEAMRLLKLAEEKTQRALEMVDAIANPKDSSP